METKRPVFLKARWDNLAMINFEVPPSILVPYLPPYTQLDFYQGKTVVSVVGFMFNNTTVFGVRWPFHTSFEEVNLRFYVKHFDGQTWKRGVVFISEIVPRSIIAFFANTLYHEQYSSMPMRHQSIETDNGMLLSYSWKQKHRLNSLEVLVDKVTSDIVAGSEEEFIFEHYWGYNQYDEKTTIEYGVEHQRWQVQTVKSWKLDCDVESLYGAEFVPFLTAKPCSVFLAKGSDVVIRKPVFIRKANR